MSGKKLLDEEINSGVSKEKSYYVVAVENTKKKDERMIASPFVKERHRGSIIFYHGRKFGKPVN